MPQADASNSTPEPPPERVVNTTLDPMGRHIETFRRAAFTPDQIAEFKSVFVARHLIASEIERLLAVLDALDGDEDFELNLAGHHWDPDPRLDDAEGDAADDEPSLAGFGGLPIYFGAADLEEDPAECGIADLDGMEEQLGRVA
jgi:hypothetical protein